MDQRIIAKTYTLGSDFPMVLLVVLLWVFLFWGEPDLADAVRANVAGMPVKEWLKLGDAP